MRIASHNVLVNLPDHRAAASVEAVLAHKPHLFGLQEWGRSRRKILKSYGKVLLFPRVRFHLGPPHPYAGYVFVYPLGGQPVAVDASRFEVTVAKRRKLSGARDGVRPCYGTEVQVIPREGGKTIAILNVHPVAHHDRPENLAAWEEAIESIREWAEEWAGFRRYVVGDFNKQRVDIPGLISCWAGREDEDTFRDRTIDHIYGPRGFASAFTVNTPSDHHAVLATEKE